MGSPQDASTRLQRCSLRALARRLGVNEKAVRKAVAAGRLGSSVGRDERDRPFIADLELALAEWVKNAARSASSGAIGDAGPSIVSAATLVEAQRLATIERGRKLRLENDLAEGRLVEVGKAAKEAFEAERTIREAMLNLPARLAGELAAETDATRIHIRLDAAIREALSSTADQLVAIVNE